MPVIDLNKQARTIRSDTFQLVAQRDARVGAMAEIAVLRKAMLDEYVKAGFDPEQAFQLLRDQITGGTPYENR